MVSGDPHSLSSSALSRSAPSGSALLAWLDQQYNPRINVSDVPSIFADWQKRSEVARNRTASKTLDLRYGKLPGEQLDVFLCSNAKSISKKAPTLVFIHGGYWRAMDKSDFSFIAEPYLANGVNVVLTNYDLCPQVSLETICRQQSRAFGWLYKNSALLGLAPNRIFVSGHSAGGHLAAMMSVVHWPSVALELPNHLIQGAISLSGLFDLRPLVVTPFLANDLRLTEDQAIQMSPALMKSEFNAPLLVAVGQKESNEFHRQSELLIAAWPSRCLPLLEVSEANHFVICDEFANSSSPLFNATMNLIATQP
jgi:arylformamidase